MKKRLNWLKEPISIILIIYILFAIAASTQKILRDKKKFTPKTHQYTSYNNYIIFKQSHFHLIDHKDLYQLYPNEHWDLYKYSPTFSLCFGLFAYFPDIIGLHLWNILNAICLFLAITYLPKIENKIKVFILLFLLIELMTSMQNSQSNGLMGGVIILSFALLERRQYLWATLCIVGSIYIKLFGIIAFSLFIFYPSKWKLVFFSMVWFVILLIMPLLVIDLSQLKFLYLSWWNLLSNDHSTSLGISVLGWLKSWFNLEINKTVLTLLGMMLLAIPLMKRKKYQHYSFRVLTLASILVWVVIFNHKAESPTFIIAMSGVALWFFLQKPSRENITLLIITFILTSLSPTDIFPRTLRDEWIKPYVLKAVPCIVVWFKISYELTLDRYPILAHIKH